MAAVALAAALGAGSAEPRGAPPREFFIVSSVDLVKGLMILKRPTEVTLPMLATPKTRLRDERGKPIPLSALRAGDTVFILSERDASGRLIASSVSQGPMTLPELRRRYLRPEPR